MEQKSKRDITVDILRGLAIFIMVGANMSALVLAEPHPMWFRIYSSVAAPLFIFLAGMMVPLGMKKHDFKYYLLRGFLVVLAGVIVDMAVWQIFPFMTYDVLYLIGLALPLTYLYLKLPVKYRWIIVTLLFLLPPLLQKHFGYSDYPTERYWTTNELTTEISYQTSVLHHWLIDGWFPVFPWLGMALIGAELGILRWASEKTRKIGGTKLLIKHLLVFAVGVAVFIAYPGALLVRGGYSELFYPPTIGLMISAVSFIILLFWKVDTIGDWRGYRWLTLLGESSLFMYIFHSAVIQYLISPYWPAQNGVMFALIYLDLIFVMLVLGYGLRVLKKKWAKPPYLVRFLIGG